MSDASFEGIRGGDGRRRTWRSDIMSTPPPVYESPRWLPPPIASTEGRRRLVKLSDDSVLYSGRERGGLRLRYRAEPRLWRFRARFRVLEAPDAFVGPHARTRRRSPLDPALTARRRHYARPGGRDEHLQNKNGSVTKKHPQTQMKNMRVRPFSRLHSRVLSR